MTRRDGVLQTTEQRYKCCFHTGIYALPVLSRALTNGDIRGAVCLQEAVEVVPDPRDPVDNLHQLYVACSAADLHLDQLPSQVAAKETFHWLHVVDTQHPPDQRSHRYIRTQKYNILPPVLKGEAVTKIM